MSTDVIDIQDSPSLADRVPVPKPILALLPPPTLRVTDILSFPLPVSEGELEPLMSNKNVFSTLPSTLTVDVALKLIPTLHIPAHFDLMDLLCSAPHALEEGNQSFLYQGTTSASDDVREIYLPFWVLTFWETAAKLTHSHRAWRYALEWLQGRDSLAGSAQGTLFVMPQVLLGSIPWGLVLSREWGGGEITSLSSFLSRRWLNDENITQLAAVLTRELEEEQNHGACIRGPWWFSKLRGAFHNSQLQVPEYCYQDSQSTAVFRDVAEGLRSGLYSSLSFQIHVRLADGVATLPSEGYLGNHWVTVIISMKTSEILYGDSYHLAAPPELLQLFFWWLTEHGFDPNTFSWQNLPCSNQEEGDTSSCGLLSYNALVHYHLPTKTTLLPSNEVEKNRALMFMKIFSRLGDMVSQLLKIH